MEEGTIVLRRDMEDIGKIHTKFLVTEILETEPVSESAFGELAFRKVTLGELTTNVAWTCD